MDGKKEYKITDLSLHLFWDADIKEVDWQKHKAYIVGIACPDFSGVMEYGTLKDWKIIKSVYGLSDIKRVALNLRHLDVFSLAFLSSILDIDKEQFRCYKLRQSRPNFWDC